MEDAAQQSDGIDIDSVLNFAWNAISWIGMLVIILLMMPILFVVWIVCEMCDVLAMPFCKDSRDEL